VIYGAKVFDRSSKIPIVICFPSKYLVIWFARSSIANSVDFFYFQIARKINQKLIYQNEFRRRGRLTTMFSRTKWKEHNFHFKFD